MADWHLPSLMITLALPIAKIMNAECGGEKGGDYKKRGACIAGTPLGVIYSSYPWAVNN